MAVQSDRIRAFRRGVIVGAPFLLVVAPFGMLFGVVATEAGFNLVEVMAFSLLVIAGASQFAAVQLMADNAPTMIVLATALAVNLRMAMYSAALAPYLGNLPLWKRALLAYGLVDQSYAASAVEWAQRPDQSLAERLAFFTGCVLVTLPFWYVFTYVGATLGQAIPPEYALDFAVPITFLAIIAPMLRTIAHVVAALVSVVVALALAFLPYGLGLLLAAVAAMLAGAFVETVLEGKAAR